MRYQRNLQIRLQEQYRRLYKADWRAFGDQARYFRDFVAGQPALRGIVALVELAEPDLDPDAWVEQHFSYRDHAWPPTRIGKTKIAWRRIERWADGEDAWEFASSFSGGDDDIPASLRAMLEQVVEPFVEYLQEHLGTQSDVLYLLEKYRRWVAWFEQNRLWSAVEEERASAKDAQVEAILDKDLRKFLFDQGVDYPFSQPTSASGRADILAGVESDDPLVCEVKLFDGKTYNARYVARGLNQAVAYAGDYGKPAGYLVVFNLSDRPIEFPSDGAEGEWPARLIVGGITIFLVQVQAHPLPPASKRGRLESWAVTRDELVQTGE